MTNITPIRNNPQGIRRKQGGLLHEEEHALLPYITTTQTGGGGTCVNQRLVLYSLANILQAKTVIEIGCAYGDTTLALCAAVSGYGGFIHGFDIWPSEDDYYNQTAVSERITAKGYDNVIIHKKNSQDADFPEVLDSLCPNKIDFAFIDGDHHYEAAKNEFCSIYPLMSDNGIIAIHDTLLFPGVKQFIAELRTTEEITSQWEIINIVSGGGSVIQPDGCGMAIMIKTS